MRYIHRFTVLAWEANAMLDQGEVLDIEATRDAINSGLLVDWFAKAYEGRVDLSLYETEDKIETARVLAEISGGADARRKFGVERNGLSLLVALSLQALQGGEDAYAEGG